MFVSVSAFEIVAVARRRRAVALVHALRPAHDEVARRNRDLASQLKRAASSVPLCIAEGARRAGRDREHLYRIAAGSAAETRVALQVAVAWGDLDRAAAEPALALVDRVLAILWRLTH